MRGVLGRAPGERDVAQVAGKVARMRLSELRKARLQATPGGEVAIGDPFVRASRRARKLLSDRSLAAKQALDALAAEERPEAVVIEPIAPVGAFSRVQERLPLVHHLGASFLVGDAGEYGQQRQREWLLGGG